MIDVEKIVREYIDKTYHMSLATVKENKPWVCEVHFAYDEGLNIYFVSKVDTRHCQEIAKNKYVAGNIVRQHELSEYPGAVYFEGEASMVENPTEDEVKLYCTRLNRDEQQLVDQLQESGGRKMYKIRIKNWAAFGKFGEDSGKKYTLAWGRD